MQLRPVSLAVSAAGDVLLGGDLAADVKVEDSTWYCGELTLCNSHVAMLCVDKPASVYDDYVIKPCCLAPPSASPGGKRG